jgi:hypothetical protein
MLISCRLFNDSKQIIKQWKKQLPPSLFSTYFLELFSDRVTLNIQQTVKEVPFSLLGALYFDRIVRELKSFI